jgi:DUF1365 family protein
MHSALYHGSLRHRRFAPREHAFNYSLFMVYLDLAELDTVFRGHWFWSTRRAALARFDRADHLGDHSVPLDCAVRDLVQSRCCWRPAGPIRLLTHLRYGGYCFNPVSFYYCFDLAGEHVECIVAEVNNTPWGEQHCYVLNESSGPVIQGNRSYRSTKAMHVSPFMPMALTYEWYFNEPSEHLSVHMALLEDCTEGRKLFDATLVLERAPVTGLHLALVLLRFPIMTLQVMGAIYWQAFKLWFKRVPVHTHPEKLKALRATKDHDE